MNPLKRGLNAGVEPDEAPRLVLAEGREESGACLWEEPFANRRPPLPFLLSPSLARTRQERALGARPRHTESRRLLLLLLILKEL